MARRDAKSPRVEPRMGPDPRAEESAAHARLAAPKRQTSATMKAALVASVLVHVGIFGYAFFVWSSPDALDAPAVENVSVDIVEVADETRLTLGDKAGDAEVPKAVRTVEAKREADEVQRGEAKDAPVREVARETPKPPPAREIPIVREIPVDRRPTEAVPEPQVAQPKPAEPAPQVTEVPVETPAESPEPQVAAAPLPPAPLGRPAGLRAPAPKPVVVAQTQPQPQPTEQPQPQPTQQVAAVTQPVRPIQPQPQPVQPQPQPLQPEPQPVQPSVSQDALLDTLDPDRIAALLNKQAPVAATAPVQAPVAEAPSLGAVDGAGDTLTISEIGALRRRLAQCWTPPLGARGAETLTVKVNMLLNEDGSVRGTPTIVDAPFGPAAEAASQAAIRAVLNCQPYQLPPQKYAVWQDITINFDPRQMLGL